MIDVHTARVIAQLILDEEGEGSKITRISEKDCCFIVWYQTKDFLETNDPRYTYGNYPIVIDKFDGSNQIMLFDGVRPFLNEDAFVLEYKRRKGYV